MPVLLLDLFPTAPRRSRLSRPLGSGAGLTTTTTRTMANRTRTTPLTVRSPLNFWSVFGFSSSPHLCRLLATLSSGVVLISGMQARGLSEEFRTTIPLYLTPCRFPSPYRHGVHGQWVLGRAVAVGAVGAVGRHLVPRLPRRQQGHGWGQLRRQRQRLWQHRGQRLLPRGTPSAPPPTP